MTKIKSTRQRIAVNPKIMLNISSEKTHPGRSWRFYNNFCCGNLLSWTPETFCIQGPLGNLGILWGPDDSTTEGSWTLWKSRRDHGLVETFASAVQKSVFSQDIGHHHCGGQDNTASAISQKYPATASEHPSQLTPGQLLSWQHHLQIHTASLTTRSMPSSGPPSYLTRG